MSQRVPRRERRARQCMSRAGLQRAIDAGRRHFYLGRRVIVVGKTIDLSAVTGARFVGGIFRRTTPSVAIFRCGVDLILEFGADTVFEEM